MNMNELQIGNIGFLSKQKIIKWQGWVVYFWDMGFCCALFSKMPKFTKGRMCWDDVLNDKINPYFLRDCGIDIKFDLPNDEGKEFYYGKDHWGFHPPIKIELNLPKTLLEQLNLI